MTGTGANVNKSGHLDVGDGHKIYWEDWGNPDGRPIMHFHGGPGGHFSDSHKRLYDPARHHVIFFDQRGAGKSTPYADLSNNTTQKLVADADKLREHLGIERMHLVGGSWGSTMVLTYAIAHPDRVASMMMWGIYLARPFENDLIANGYSKYNFPEAWERFIGLVPKEHQGDGTAITKYYAGKINSTDEQVARKYADEWALWETSLVSLSYDRVQLEQEVVGDEANLSLARFETHYFLNNCFLPDGYILDNVGKINHLPCYVVQGRFDHCTPPASAVDLSRAYGDNLTLQMVRGGHMRSDPELLAALRAVANTRLV